MGRSNSCKVPNCKSGCDGLTVFRMTDVIRKSPDVLEKWIEALGDGCTEPNFRICSDHFEEKQILKPIKGPPRLHPNAFPCRNLDAFEIIEEELSTSSQKEGTEEEEAMEENEIFTEEYLEEETYETFALVEEVEVSEKSEVEADNIAPSIDKLDDNINDFETAHYIEEPKLFTIHPEEEAQNTDLVDGCVSEKLEDKFWLIEEAIRHEQPSEEQECLECIEDEIQSIIYDDVSSKRKRNNYSRYKNCKVPSCINEKRGSVSVFSLPEAVRKCEDLLAKWNQVLDVDCSLKSFRICGDHFLEQHILKSQLGRIRLHPKAFPCRYLPKSVIVGDDEENEIENDPISNSSFDEVVDQFQSSPNYQTSYIESYAFEPEYVEMGS